MKRCSKTADGGHLEITQYVTLANLCKESKEKSRAFWVYVPCVFRNGAISCSSRATKPDVIKVCAEGLRGLQLVEQGTAVL